MYNIHWNKLTVARTLLCGVLICFQCDIVSCHRNKLFYFLVDGFRWDYIDNPDLHLPGFSRLLREGVRAQYMTPEFPTNSFPNYKTLETGLHVESHGFVGNYMYDTDRRSEFDFENPDSNREKHWWDGAESFYVTANKQGVRSALYYIFGCNLPYDGGPLTFCRPYARKPTREEIDWAIQDGIRRLHDDEVDIVYVMHVDVDTQGHLYGPTSPEVMESIVEVDQHVSDILDLLHVKNLDDVVDLILVSDHGMSPLDTSSIINMTSALNMDDVEFITETGAMAYIWPKNSRHQQVYDSIKKLSPHLHVLLREDFFQRWFFKGHRLTPPILAYADPGWTLVHPGTSARGFEVDGVKWLGNHGFDNSIQDMRATFLAKGPHFKQSQVSQPISSVDVYQLLCHVTGIKPRPHDGNWSHVQDMLSSNNKHTDL